MMKKGTVSKNLGSVARSFPLWAVRWTKIYPRYNWDCRTSSVLDNSATVRWSKIWRRTFVDCSISWLCLLLFVSK
jgi:hypothetical protein